MLFSVKDALRQQVEAASGGLATVVYTKKGQPVFMRVVPKFTFESAVHPAFLVGDREVSEIWVGMFPGYASNEEIISYPGLPPSSITPNNAVAMARAMGPGFHVITAAEWAAVALYSVHVVGEGSDPVYGPDPYGMSLDGSGAFGRRVDSKAPGDTSSTSYCLGGSGPLNWRHDGREWGIADLVQGINPATYVAGLILRNGEINVIPNNNAALPNVDLSPTSDAWQAILPTGELVNPGANGTLKFDIPPNAAYNGNTNANLGPPYLSTTRKTPPWPDDDYTPHDYALSSSPPNLKYPDTLNVPPIIYQLALFTNSPGRGNFFVRPYGVRVVNRGWRGIYGLYAGSTLTVGLLQRIAYIPM